MSYTSKTIKKHLLIYGGVVLLSALPFAIGTDDGILIIGLSGLCVGAIYGGGLIIAALIVAATHSHTRTNASADRDPSVVDASEGVVVVSASERSKAYLLAGLLIMLIGGSLCVGSLNVGPPIRIH